MTPMPWKKIEASLGGQPSGSLRMLAAVLEQTFVQAFGWVLLGALRGLRYSAGGREAVEGAVQTTCSHHPVQEIWVWREQVV